MTTEDPSANVVPIRPPATGISDLDSFEAEVSRKLSEDYGDVSGHVKLGRIDKVFLANGSIEKGLPYPGLDGTVVAAIFADKDSEAYVVGDLRVFVAPKNFNEADRYLAFTLNRDTSRLSVRSTLLRDDFVEAVVAEWENVFGPPEEEEDDGCMVDDCEGEIVYECTCQVCSAAEESYACCEEHRAQLDPDHLKEQGRPAVWQKIATPALPQ